MGLKIIFLGTPEFAVPSLKILIEHGYDVVGVITATDKLGGRGKKKLIQSAVKKYAVEQGLKVLQPKNLKNPEFVEEVRALGADLQVVVAFRMLPRVIWDMPRLGTMNLHGSLLPKYRGAAPINWAVIKGEKETGVTTFLLKQKIDTGDVLQQKSLPIGENETTGEVYNRMMEMGAGVLLESVKVLESGDYKLLPQNDAIATKAPKVFHDTSEVDFIQPTQKVHDFIRGLSPYPTAWTMLNDKKLKIFRSKKELIDHDEEPGKFFSDNKKYLKVSTIDGYVHLEELQLAGKKRMEVKAFLNGYKLELTES
ncbi:MAG: methionyl-tRNA formyltransferase [Saprospiraceae bacterium]